MVSGKGWPKALWYHHLRPCPNHSCEDDVRAPRLTCESLLSSGMLLHCAVACYEDAHILALRDRGDWQQGLSPVYRKAAPRPTCMP